MDLGRDGGIHSHPSHKILGRIGIAGRERCVPQWVAIHDRHLRTQESPANLCARTQVKCAGKERAADVAALQKETIGIPFLNFKSEWNANEAKGKFPVPLRPRLARGQLGPRQSDRHAFDRIRVQLDRRAKEFFGWLRRRGVHGE